ncbi:MAG TPA: restriction endonuclease subunit S [Candidatus Ligilactobacillus excrementipullorum]|nr:restriction endonuclease subunit S [Candidatus Ligilactobacillus excrementipullorum]
MISNIADSVVTGKTPSTKDESNYGYDVPFITIPDMHSQVFTTQTARYLSKKGADSQIKKYLPPYTLSVSSIGTPGLVTINPVEAQTNQQINSIIAEKEKIWYLFLAFDSLKKYIKNMGSGGSTILNLNKSNFKKIEIDWPSNNDTLVEINKFLDPIFMSILNNQQEIDNLVIIRDYLLSELL